MYFTKEMNSINSITPWKDIVASGFPLSEYYYADEAGVIGATLVAKTQGKQSNIIAFFDSDDVGKIKVSVWSDSDDYGLLEGLAIGTFALLTLSETQSGRIRVANIEIEE